MNAWRWSWALFAAVAVAVPGCLLVQPLDDAKPGTGGATSSGGDTHGDSGDNGDGDAGSGPSPSGGKAGAASGGKGGAGPQPTAGSGPTGDGGATSGVDFSLFLGDWYIVSGTTATLCDDDPSTTPTVTAVDPNSHYDHFDVGTTSDLLWDLDSECPLLVDVDDRTASSEPNHSKQTCDTVAETTHYLIHITSDSFEFKVSAGDQTATSSTHLSAQVSDTNGNYVRTCVQNVVISHSRIPPASGT